MKPDISVIIPVYKGQRYIAEAINSALSQTGVNHEVLVVDNCSDEETTEKIKKYVDTDERLFYISTSANEGLAGVRNTGVAAASGNWVAFLHADDKWHNDKLFRQNELIRQYELSGKYPPLCYTGAYVLKRDGCFTGRSIKAPLRVTSQELLLGKIILTSTVMVRRECMLEYPFESGNLHEDYIGWFRILDKYGPGIGVSLPLTRYRLTKGPKTRRIKSAHKAWRTYRYLGLTNAQALVSFLYFIAHGLQRYVL